MHHDDIAMRRRGTAIVDTPEGILLTVGAHGYYLLPGGKARDDEPRIKAAARELHEETGLTALTTKFLFHHIGEINKRYHYRDHHTVCLIKVSGRAIPRHEVKRIGYYSLGCKIRVSVDTRAIIERYYARMRGKETDVIIPSEPSRSGPNDTNVSGASQRIFLTSDLHLDHTNIIRYCHRPFRNAQTMNKTLIYNWNKIVKPNDKIYFLGDLAPFKTLPIANRWLDQLYGEKICIQGSHDPPNFGVSHIIIPPYNGFKFLLVHDPSPNPKFGKSPIPPDWQGWVIHGHIHNNDMRKYPFINGRNRTINLSVELINYKPISLEFLVSLGLDKIKRMDTIDSIPERC